MSRDLLATVAERQQTFGDVVYLRIWPEHQLVVSDPQLVRALLVNHHDESIRWARGMRVFAEVHGHGVLIAEAPRPVVLNVSLRPEEPLRLRLGPVAR